MYRNVVPEFCHEEAVYLCGLALFLGDSLEITFEVRVFQFFLGLFLIMQLFEICDKKQMA